MILRLLIVEDEKQICDAVAKSLYDAGYEVDTCYAGEEALEYIQADEYVEVTPHSMRLRKILLHEVDRKRASK